MMRFWHWLFRRVLVGPFVRMLFPTEIIGLENLPRKGGFIIAANHQAEIDSLIIGAQLYRYRVRFYTKAEYFGNGPIGAFLRLSGQIPVNRQDTRSAAQVIDIGRQVLEDGDVLGVFPEGTRSTDGRLHRGRLGAVQTAIAAAYAPIVPIGLIGTEKLNPTSRRLPRPGRVVMVIGKPIDRYGYQRLSRDAHQDNLVGRAANNKAVQRAVERAVTDALMRDISKLSGRPYVPDYLKIPKR